MLAVINNALLFQLKPKFQPYDVRDKKLTGNVCGSAAQLYLFGVVY